VEVQLHAFLTSALVGCEWLASCPGHFTRGETVPGTHWIYGQVGHRTTIDAMLKRKNPFPSQEGNPGHPAHSLDTILTELL